MKSRTTSQGFTLIELVGTLAIVVLLAGVASEGVFNHLRETQRQNEAAHLGAVGSALVRGVTKWHAIPAETNWASLAGAELEEPAQQILRNPAGWNRRLIFDPDFRVGTPLAGPPYLQTAAGSLTPTNARAVLLSTLAADFPSLTGVGFDDLWECPPGRLPAHWPSRWAGKPGDLFIERISLLPHFHRVCLNNLNLDETASFAVDGTNQVATIPAGGRVDSAYLTGTRIHLLSPDGAVQESVSLDGSVSFAFEAGRWQRSLFNGPAALHGPLALAFDQFVHSPPSGFGAAPSDVALAMHEWTGDYLQWAAAGFPRTEVAPGQPHPAFRRVSEAQSRLSEFAALLLGSNPP